MRILSALIFSLLLNTDLQAEAIKQSELNFKIVTQKLLKGETHYSVSLATPARTLAKLPEAKELDSLQLLKTKDSAIFLAKSVYVVERPVGFFDSDRLTSEDFISHLLGDQKITKESDSVFKVKVPGKKPLSYDLRIFFDSDDISTLPQSRSVHSVAAVRKLDVISQSASSLVYREMTNFSEGINGSVNISTYIPLKENKTLIISYTLSSIKKEQVRSKQLEKDFVQEILSQKELIQNFTEK